MLYKKSEKAKDLFVKHILSFLESQLHLEYSCIPI